MSWILKSFYAICFISESLQTTTTTVTPSTTTAMTTTATPIAIVNADVNEHKYIITQVILNKNFDSNIMTKGGDWSDNFEDDIANTLSISNKQVDVIGTWDSMEDDVADAIVDFLLYGNTDGSDPNDYVETLKDKVDAGLFLEKTDANAYGITVNDKTIYDKSRWQRAKDYANNRWDTFQNAEMSAPIVTAWVFGLGIPFCICTAYVLYKCKEKQSNMVDEGVITVKLNTVKTSI